MNKNNKKDPKKPVGKISLEDLANSLKGHKNKGKTESKKFAQTGVPTFPYEVLPPQVQSFITISEKALGTPADFLASAVLMATSIAMGRTHLLELKKGSRHSGLLFLALVGNPNANKTKSLQFPLQPIFDRDAERYRDFKNEMAEYEVVAEMSKKERQSAGISEVWPRPIWRKTIVQDATQEAIGRIHQNNLRGIAIYRDELMGWIKSFNRYNSGGEQEFWLSAWSSGPLGSDRNTTEEVYIRQSYIPVVGTIQPGILQELVKDNRQSNGFVDRLLFTWPDNLHKPLWTNKEMPQEAVDDYHAGINKLLDLTFDEDNQPHIITLNQETRDSLFQFFNKNNKPLCDSAENELLQGIHGKFDIHAARFCLILQMLWWAFGEIDKDQVELPMIEKAIKLTEYFRMNSLKVFDKLQNDSPVDQLMRDKRELYESLPTVFKTGEGLTIAERLGMKERTFKRFLINKKLFERMGHGVYEKVL